MEIKKVEWIFMLEEKWWNCVLVDLLYIFCCYMLVFFVFFFYDKYLYLIGLECSGVKEDIDFRVSGGMNGFMYLCEGEVCLVMFIFLVDGMFNIINN